MASNFRVATIGQALPLRYSTSQSISGLYVQCKLYNSSDALAYTVNLTESVTQTGRYVGSVTITTEGDYEAFYIAYDDAGHTIESEIAPRASEAIIAQLTQAIYGGSQPSVGGITDNDIEAIIEGVAKKIGYKDPWDIELRPGITAREELLNKSELREVKLPPVDFSKIDTLSENVKKGFEMVDNTISALPEAYREPKEQDLSPITGDLNYIKNKLAIIKPSEVDKKVLTEKLKPILSKLDQISQEMPKNEVEIPEVDLTPILSAVESLENVIKGIKMPIDNTEKLLKQFSDIKISLKENTNYILNHDSAEFKRLNHIINVLKVKEEV